MNYTEKQLNYIRRNVAMVDVECLYDRMLDECYSFRSVGGPFEYLQPSHVLARADETAYLCGLADYQDSLAQERDYVEIDGDLYAVDDIEEALEDMEDEEDEDEEDEDEEDEDEEDEDEEDEDEEDEDEEV
jgi:hypothetical protein